MNLNSNSPKVLLVEGKSDKHVVLGLVEKANLAQSSCVNKKIGANNLLAAIALEIKTDNRKPWDYS